MMPLAPDAIAPDFTLYDDARQPWTLSEQVNDGYRVVLLFFPGAFSDVCTSEMNTVNNSLARYSDARARVVGLSSDSPDVLAEFRRVHELHFSLLSDHDAAVAAAYGVRFSPEEHLLGFSRVAKRAVFVVGLDGRISYAEQLAHPGLEPDYEALLSALEG